MATREENLKKINDELEKMSDSNRSPAVFLGLNIIKTPTTTKTPLQISLVIRNLFNGLNNQQKRGGRSQSVNKSPSADGRRVFV